MRERRKSQLNVGILPQPGSAQKQDPDFVVQPRYWVEKAEVDAKIPRFPQPVASALRQGGDALRQAMTLWAAGYYLNREETAHGERLLGLSQLGGLMAASAEQAAASRVLATALEQRLSAGGMGRGIKSNVNCTILSRLRASWSSGSVRNG